MKYYFIPSRIAIIRKTISAGKNVEKLGYSYVSDGTVKWCI